MSAKITLYSDEDIIKKIKLYAKEQNTSVSQIVNNFFKTLLVDNQTNHKDKATISTSLYGVLEKSNIKEDDYKKYLESKYL
jgi:hypothetical protein